jgi:uncharacterized protein with GYD domain
MPSAVPPVAKPASSASVTRRLASGQTPTRRTAGHPVRIWEGLPMSTYILLAQWTDQGIKNAKGSPKRAEDSRAMAKKFGVEWKSFFMTMGAYDFVVTVEAPDDQALAKFVIALGTQGNVRTTTLKAFTESEYKGIVGAAG